MSFLTPWWLRRPSGADATRTIQEDQSYALKATDFGCVTGLTAVRIDSLPGAGRLLLDGVAVSAGQTVSKAAIDAGRLVFQPEADASGSGYARFTFSVKDGSGCFDSCPNTFRINVCAVNDAPIARDDTATTQAGKAVAIAVLLNDSDADNARSELKVTQASVLDPSKGTVTVNADGSLSFTPAAGVSGTVELSYTVKDPAGLADTARVLVNVEPAPVATQCLTFDFNGSTATDGADGNVRTYTAGSVSLHASAFSRDDCNGTWSTAWLGSYGGGLGVTNRSEGSGANAAHTLDNTGGQHDYILLEFSQQVVLDKAYLGYVVCDSDIQVWIGNVAGAFDKHVALNDATLKGLGFTEVNSTTLGTARWADLNAGNIAGNVIVIAADTTDGSPEDQFKLQQLKVCAAAPADSAPEGTDALRTLAEDSSYTVLTADFGFRDADVGQTLAAVRIHSLPARGSLTLNGVAVTAGQVIEAAAIAAGQLRFSPAANESASPYAAFGFNVQDSSGRFDESPNAITFNVTPVNDGPQLDSITTALSEEGLVGGIADAQGTADTTDAVVASGTVGATDTDGDALSFSLQAPSASLSAGGVALTWQGSGTAQLVALAGTREVLRATIEADGRYQVELLAPLDHPDTQTEDVLTLDLGLIVSDGSAQSTATLRVSVQDDAPASANVVQAMPEPSVDTNLLLVLDISGSMNLSSGVVDDATGATLSRLQLEQRAINALLDQYDALGDVRVRIVTFSTQAQSLADPVTGEQAWVDVATARAQIAAIVATGFTNYDAALNEAMSAYTAPGADDLAQNVAYFLSDGDPTAADTGPIADPSVNPDIGIQAEEQAAWEAFLAREGITGFALGVGSEVTQVNLEPVAYDGATGNDAGAVVVTDLSQLAGVLTGTVRSDLLGKLVSGVAQGSGLGADGGHVRAVTIDGTEYVYDPVNNAVSGAGVGGAVYDTATHTLRLSTTAGGQLAIDFDDGTYRYAAGSGDAATRESIAFEFIDNDGDIASGSLTLGLGGSPLEGGLGGDVFRWTLANAGDAGLPNGTTVADFTVAAPAAGGDVLDLRDLLQGETADTLGRFLDLEATAEGTVLHVSSAGEFAEGVDAAAREDVRILLAGVDLGSNLGLPGGSDTAIIDALLRQGQLQIGG